MKSKNPILKMLQSSFPALGYINLVEDYCPEEDDNDWPSEYCGVSEHGPVPLIEERTLDGALKELELGAQAVLRKTGLEYTYLDYLKNRPPKPKNDASKAERDAFRDYWRAENASALLHHIELTRSALGKGDTVDAALNAMCVVIDALRAEVLSCETFQSGGPKEKWTKERSQWCKTARHMGKADLKPTCDYIAGEILKTYDHLPKKERPGLRTIKDEISPIIKKIKAKKKRAKSS